MPSKFTEWFLERIDPIFEQALVHLEEKFKETHPEETWEYDDFEEYEADAEENVSSNLICKTFDNAPPDDMHRVFFVCHPNDFATCFELLCNDIFSVNHKVTIYCIKDMTVPFTRQERELAMGKAELVIVPVTEKLLTDKNSAMDNEIAYAKKMGIPILPFLMESQAENYYSSPENFGNIQYLNPQSNDITEISYKEKLKKYLDSTLLDDDMISRINAEFKHRIFLSYRKKDRQYVNRLMRLIHSAPGCRDVAIWYDEYLTPGENFSANIRKHLKESQLIMLLVTPNLLEEPNGKPNFVMGAEYPEAKKLNTPILPIEMVDTDQVLLSAKYPEIPECSDADDEQAFYQRLTEMLKGTKKRAVPDDLLHQYLIGMAYMKGINTETDRKLALEMITDSARMGLTEAMQRLSRMYLYGIDVAKDVEKAIYWGGKAKELCLIRKGGKDPDTVRSVYGLGECYSVAQMSECAINEYEMAYALQCGISGKDDNQALLILNELAKEYENAGMYKKALETLETVCFLRYKTLDERHTEALSSMYALTEAYRKYRCYGLAMNLSGLLYDLLCKYVGRSHHAAQKLLKTMESDKRGWEHQWALESLGSKDSPELIKGLTQLRFIAFVYIDSHLDDNINKAMEAADKAYKICRTKYGEYHHQTYTSTATLAVVYAMDRKTDKAMELLRDLYTKQVSAYGETHASSTATFDFISSLKDHCKKLNAVNRKSAKKDTLLGIIKGVSLVDIIEEEMHIDNEFSDIAKDYLQVIFKG